MKSTTIACILSLSLTSCGALDKAFRKHQNNNEQAPPEQKPDPSAPPGGAPTPPIANTHLIFGAIDPLATPWQASIYELDLKSLTVAKLLSGESGDPAFFLSAGEVLFFNRDRSSQNYRRIFPSAQKNSFSTQQRFAGGEIGDPHDVVYLGNDKVLLAHYTQGALVVMQQSTGKELARVEADWDLPQGVTLKPEALMPMTIDGKSFIYVIHQALTFKDGGMQANGSQQAFLLSVSDTVEAVDLNLKNPRVQGIPLRGSFPTALRYRGGDKIILVSMCSTYIDNSTPCASAVEEIDAKSRTVSTLWDLDKSSLYMNGPVTAGSDRDTFFANVEQQVDAITFQKKIVKLSIRDKKIQPVYDFPSASPGFWATFFDENSKMFYIGDIAKDSVGKFVIISDDGSRKELPLEHVPYSGVLVSKSGT